jgi:transcriptional regulator of arginine metabolism
MKNRRHEVIIELIHNNILTTQDELQEALENLGFKVTQSTVSRDIKELRIVKAQDRNGVYRYLVAGKNNETMRDRNHFEEMFAKSCIDAAYSMNTVIIKCYAGMASSVCVALEQLFNDIILGSLAGDDTIFAITSGEKDSVALVEKIKKLI